MKGLNGFVSQVAEEKAKRICNKVIRLLQKMPAGLSDDDSGLDNVWDEVCVQVQVEMSYSWVSYEETIKALVDFEVEELKSHEQLALWVQTPEFIEWESEQDEMDSSDEVPVYNPDIVRYLIQEYILREACDWSNQRIRNYNNSRYGY